MFNQEKKVIDAIEKTLPAVVSISVVKKIKDIEKESPDLIFPMTEKDDKIRKGMMKNISGKNFDVGGGSGFIVSSNGIVITNMHVVFEGQFDYEITANDGRKDGAKLVGIDIINDIAFLKIQSDRKFPYLELADSSKVKLGQTALAIGNALGMFRNTVSCGIISGLSRSIQADNDYIKENLKGLIQTDAAINPGNSGGPLVDLFGKAIGINSASVFSAENIGFAIPINVIKEDLQKILRGENLKKVFIGVRYIIINKDIRNVLKLKEERGALIKSQSLNQEAVIKNGPADKAGIKDGDVIIKINNEEITEESPLDKIISRYKNKDKVNLEIIRKGKKIKKILVLEER